MTVLLPEFQGVLDAACQSFRRVSLEGAGALCEGVGRQEANALDLFRDTIRIGLQDRLEIRNGRDDLFSDFGADAQFGEHGMRSVFGHLLAPRGEQGLGLFLADQIGKELRSEEHTSELQSLMRISYAVFCLKKKNKT